LLSVTRFELFDFNVPRHYRSLTPSLLSLLYVRDILGSRGLGQFYSSHISSDSHIVVVSYLRSRLKSINDM